MSTDTPPSPEGKKDRDFVTALARGLDILKCFTAERPELGSTDIAQLTGLAQSTVWRLCHTLTELGYLVPAGSDRLRAGLGVLTLGGASVARAGIAYAAYPGMAEIADRFDASLSLAGKVGTTMVIVQRAEAPGMLRLNFTVGTAMALERSAVGGAYLGAAAEAERRATLASLQAQLPPGEWPATEAWLGEAVEMVRAHGYVLNLRRYHPDVCAVAVPLVSNDRRTIMALNCGGPASRMSVELLTGPILSALRALANQLQPLL
ncbi:IclR family transcriptional regulator [Hydrogenophaga sp. BPS33]|uniref:IclR family transcriptional regulator n=1 Tax=Hydrogenophaga sp. BPS33 TaxID=2651974 RepID=UPI001359E1B6|nr:helix-turn-helix domain-containing protein [Hydrogenophaga sp. BPS33]